VPFAKAALDGLKEDIVTFLLNEWMNAVEICLWKMMVMSFGGCFIVKERGDAWRGMECKSQVQ
jgi:hypothetical protein